MTDKLSTRTPELERRLEYAKRIRKVFGYEGTADHEDVQSILRKFQEEITKELTDRIVGQLEELADDRRKYWEIYGDDEVIDLVAEYNEVIASVKGIQNE